MFILFEASVFENLPHRFWCKIYFCNKEQWMGWSACMLNFCTDQMPRKGTQSKVTLLRENSYLTGETWLQKYTRLMVICYGLLLSLFNKWQTTALSE